LHNPLNWTAAFYSIKQIMHKLQRQKHNFLSENKLFQCTNELAVVIEESKPPPIRDQKQRSMCCDWCSSKTITNSEQNQMAVILQSLSRRFLAW